ncbi:unnamed protein product [Lampetra planeri]
MGSAETFAGFAESCFLRSLVYAVCLHRPALGSIVGKGPWAPSTVARPEHSTVHAAADHHRDDEASCRLATGHGDGSPSAAGELWRLACVCETRRARLQCGRLEPSGDFTCETEPHFIFHGIGSMVKKLLRLTLK